MKNKGFTLAELLIALAILGVIATFTIPKVLTSSTSSQMTAVAKEVAGMISGAQQAKVQTSAIAAADGPDTLTPFMNYVKVDTGGTNPTDGVDGDATTLCSNAGTIQCLQLHNGGLLQYATNQNFSTGATTSTHAVYFNLDPDGATGAQPSVTFVTFINGRLTTGANAVPGTDFSTDAGAANYLSPDPSYIQNWN